jgi:hypothetical protein
MCLVNLILVLYREHVNTTLLFIAADSSICFMVSQMSY